MLVVVLQGMGVEVGWGFIQQSNKAAILAECHAVLFFLFFPVPASQSLAVEGPRRIVFTLPKDVSPPGVSE